MKTILNSDKFYDLLAQDYDQKMGEHAIHDYIRDNVSQYFRSITGVNKIIDFGAGTGEDLKWQLESNYKIVFFEPSSQMANIARKKFDIDNAKSIDLLVGKGAKIETLWKSYPGTIDAIFSNFAVLNSIKNLDLLFDKFHAILRSKGHFVFVLFQKFEKSILLKSMLASYFISGKYNKTLMHSEDGNAMHVYIHLRRPLIRTASKQGFTLEKEIKLAESGHVLYHFIKKS